MARQPALLNLRQPPVPRRGVDVAAAVAATVVVAVVVVVVVVVILRLLRPWMPSGCMAPRSATPRRSVGTRLARQPAPLNLRQPPVPRRGVDVAAAAAATVVVAVVVVVVILRLLRPWIS